MVRNIKFHRNYFLEFYKKLDLRKQSKIEEIFFMIDIDNIHSFDELLDAKYGKKGSPDRMAFELRAKSFMIGEMLKEARKEAKMTQGQLASKVGTKKSYISRVENGKVDIQLSTLYRIFEEGLGKRINLTFS